MTKSTEEMSKELHDWLKRDGECWHNWHYGGHNHKTGRSIHYCYMCQTETMDIKDLIHINFFSPATEDQAAINFFWLWDRMMIWEDNKYLSFMDSIGGAGRFALYISCTELAKALYEFKDAGE